jgi:hypothetical protein
MVETIDLVIAPQPKRSLSRLFAAASKIVVERLTDDRRSRSLLGPGNGVECLTPRRTEIER